MDLSKEYIKMCKKAEEIQKLFAAEEGDFYIESDIVDVSNGGWTNFEKRIFNGIWLPRQDQLQDMIEETWIKKQVAFYDFIFEYATDMCTTCFNEKLESIHNFADGNTFYEKAIQLISKAWGSFEKAWLVFLMHNKYKKTWDGSKWIKIQEKQNAERNNNL